MNWVQILTQTEQYRVHILVFKCKVLQFLPQNLVLYHIMKKVARILLTVLYAIICYIIAVLGRWELWSKLVNGFFQYNSMKEWDVNLILTWLLCARWYSVSTWVCCGRVRATTRWRSPTAPVTPGGKDMSSQLSVSITSSCMLVQRMVRWRWAVVCACLIKKPKYSTSRRLKF